MAYALDITSETTANASDLENDQGLIKIDATTNSATLIAKDSAGDAITIPLGGAAGAFIADPAGGGTIDAQARAAIVSIIDVLIDRGLIASS